MVSEQQCPAQELKGKAALKATHDCTSLDSPELLRCCRIQMLCPRHELERMRGASCSPSADDIERQRMAAQQQAEAEMAKAQERTARMLEVRWVL